MSRLPAVSLISIALLGLVPAGEARNEPTPSAPRGEVVLPSGKVLLVEVADTPEKRARGYMHRDRIGDEEGMVFLMGEVGFHAFWMKNCKVELDILWLDENWRVVHLLPRVPPCRSDPCPSYTPMQAGLYVLEIRGGLAAVLGLKVGDHIIFTPPPPPAAGR